MEQLASRLGSTSAVDDMLSGADSNGAGGDSGTSAPVATHTILFKSVSLARKEKRGLAAMDAIAADAARDPQP